MSKRAASALGEQASGKAFKRRKVEDIGRPKHAPIEIHSARQLQDLLKFHQDSVTEFGIAVQALKKFLESIIYPKDVSQIPEPRSVLREFLSSQAPRESADGKSIFLPDLMEAWRFAEQTNRDWLCSSIIAALALLLKAIAAALDLRDYGVSLCKTILQIPQAKLLSRGLSAPPHKDYLISPCLRLLTEAVTFDGGTCAKYVYLRRDLTFDTRTLVRNLHLRTGTSADPAQVRKRPSVRSNAVRYLLANLPFQGGAAKSEILRNGNVLRALFQHIQNDPPEVIRDALAAVQNHVILDQALPRSTKGYLLSEQNLASIATLYKYDHRSTEEGESDASIRILVHKFLLFVCTEPNLGALVESSGWYPPGTDKQDEELAPEDESYLPIDLGLDSLEWYRRYKERVPVRNTTLSAFIQGLRPHADSLEAELLLAIFGVAPELVADYFFRKASFPFDPKLSATWIGYSSFLFRVVQLPVPDVFGLRQKGCTFPPPPLIVIESILPQPLNQKSLTRCLNQKSDLITFFAARLSLVAFRKLQSVLRSFKAASKERPVLWEQASAALTDEFVRRCPLMKDVISSFRSTSPERILQREAITRLLVMYYEVTPEIAVGEKFDVSVALTSALNRFEENEPQSDESGLYFVELQHLLEIAYHSPGMRWWHKPESLDFSPFTTLIRLIAIARKAEFYDQVKHLLLSITDDYGILQQRTRQPALDALIHSLRPSLGFSPTKTLFEFLDSCIGRLVRKLVKYQDDLGSLIQSEHASQTLRIQEQPTISLLWLTLAEQWPFVSKYDVNLQGNIAHWLARYVHFSVQIGEDRGVLDVILHNLSTDADLDRLHADFLAYKSECEQRQLKMPSEVGSEEEEEKEKGGRVTTISTAKAMGERAAFDLKSLEPPREKEDHPELNRWMRKEPQESVEDGTLGALVMCLSSQHTDIRLQALSNIYKFIDKTMASPYEEREQLRLLLTELLESSKELVTTKSLPTFTAAWVAYAISVLGDPTHIMYPKINKYLTRGPSWNVSKLPSYWIDKIFLNPPTEDTAHYLEVEWLLDVLMHGLCTSEDMDMYRASKVFERVLALYSSPYLLPKLKEKILKLLFRATYANGSTTLITRTGILNWTDAQIALNDTFSSALKQLGDRLQVSCDMQRVAEWSKYAVRSK